MKLVISTILGFCFFSVAAFSSTPIPVQGVELDEYQGRWFEIARIPQDNDTQGRCRNTQALYEVLEDGTIGVENQCEISILGLEVKQRIFGIATPLSSDEGIFKLDLRPLSSVIPFGNKYTRGFKVEGDCWILELDLDYQYALIGNPSRTNLFVISRTPDLDPEIFLELIELASTKHGYGDSVYDLEVTDHDGVAPLDLP